MGAKFCTENVQPPNPFNSYIKIIVQVSGTKFMINLFFYENYGCKEVLALIVPIVS